MSARILIVDDEEIVVRSCLRILAGGDYAVESAQDGLEALKKIEEDPFDVLVLDIMMPKIGGLEVLQRVKESHPDIDVIMITGLSQIETAVKAMKLGAFDYLPKPFDPDELKLVVKRALERRQLLRENVDLRNEVSAKYRFENIIGSSPRMQGVFRLVAKCAPTSSTVLLTGESGTGKELIARAIHYNSLRKDRPFVAVDCNALSEGLLESEMFGHVKGSFTGAVKDKQGLFTAAAGGTFFLDEIGETTPATQVKLLRVLQHREVIPVGATEPIPIDTRLIAATNRDLEEAMRRATFRQDLYYRLNVISLHLPPLRERKDDIPLLVESFRQRLATTRGGGEKTLSDDATEAIQAYQWPGNVRELENALERAWIMSPGNRIEVNALPERVTSPTPSRLLDERVAPNPTLEAIERAYILWVLNAEGGNKTKAAESLGIDPSTLHRKLSRFGTEG
jgi:DNA-binding NtrC family response regulator